MGTVLSQTKAFTHTLKMKFFALFAIVGFASAQKLSAQQQKKLQNKGQAAINNAVAQAESFAKQNGIKLDLNSLYDSLQAQYGAQVESAVAKAQAQAQQKKLQREQAGAINQAKSMTLNKARNQVQGAANAAIKNSNLPADVQNVLKQLIQKSNKEFNAALKANKLNGSVNLEKLAKNQFKKHNVANKAQQQINKAVNQINNL